MKALVLAACVALAGCAGMAHEHSPYAGQQARGGAFGIDDDGRVLRGEERRTGQHEHGEHEGSHEPIQSGERGTCHPGVLRGGSIPRRRIRR